MRKPLDRSEVLHILKQELPYLKERYGVLRIALYGSFAYDTPHRRSDVDLLVELSRPLGLEFVSLADHLEKALGRKVDLATFETLHRSIHNPRYRSIALSIQRTLTDVATETR